VIAAAPAAIMLNPVFDDMEHLEIFASADRPEALSGVFCVSRGPPQTIPGSAPSAC
jgi:hypothetical protein